MVDPLSYYNWCKVHGMYYPVCEMVYIKDRLLLIGKSSSSSGRFPLNFCVANMQLVRNLLNVKGAAILYDLHSVFHFTFHIYYIHFHVFVEIEKCFLMVIKVCVTGCVYMYICLKHNTFHAFHPPTDHK